MGKLLSASRAYREELARFDPDLLSGVDAAAAAEEFAAVEKAAAAARARAAARAAACGAHRRQGFAHAEEWLARTSGTSTREAREALETAEVVKSCPATAAAFSRGDLSLSQASIIARTERARPGSEIELLLAARVESVATLRDRARTKRLEAIDPDELHRRQRRAREFRHWRDELGMVRFTGALTPEVGVPFVNQLDAETDRIRARARKAGIDEPRDAHAADAFAAIVAGGGRGRSSRADVVLVCDLNAYRRGHAHAGERCHIVGGGPVPVSVARRMAGDAFIKAVLHNGTQIQTVEHFGRHISAELRTALELGPAPDFTGTACVEPGCGRRYGLEWDHVDPVANHGPTSYANLRPRCYPHHQAKTARDRAAGLLDGDERGPP